MKTALITIIILLTTKAVVNANAHVVGDTYSVTPEVSCMEIWDAQGSFETLCLEAFQTWFGTDVRPVEFNANGEIIRN